MPHRIAVKEIIVKIDRIVVTYTVLVPTGSYANERVEVTLESSTEPLYSEKHDAATLLEIAKNICLNAADEIRHRHEGSLPLKLRS